MNGLEFRQIDDRGETHEIISEIQNNLSNIFLSSCL